VQLSLTHSGNSENLSPVLKAKLGELFELWGAMSEGGCPAGDPDKIALELNQEFASIREPVPQPAHFIQHYLNLFVIRSVYLHPVHTVLLPILVTITDGKVPSMCVRLLLSGQRLRLRCLLIGEDPTGLHEACPARAVRPTPASTHPPDEAFAGPRS
jgi:hypothetical protein